MSALMDYYNSLVNPAPAATATQTQATSTGMPDWYNQYVQGIAGQAVAAGQNASQTQAPQQSVAGFTPAQTQAFQQVQNNQGSWAPAMGAAMSDTGTAAAQADNANQHMAGPSQSWTDPGTAAKYMSPYTDSVVNEIARLGNQNFNEQIMPGVNSGMIGSGQFGSTRNADVLGHAARDTEQNILGQQSSALQQGYTQAQATFGQDANRAQQQQQSQASTILAGGALLNQSGQQMGALGQAQSQLGLQDAQSMQAIGQQQQQLQQQGLDTGYTNQVANNNWDWNNLNNMSSIVRGAQLPTTSTASTNGPLSRSYVANQAPINTLTGTAAGLAGS